MKKIIFLTLASTLILGGCGEESDISQAPVTTQEISATSEISSAPLAVKSTPAGVPSPQTETIPATSSLPAAVPKVLPGDTIADAKIYTLADIAEHNTPDDCWTGINGNVADVTSFFGTHPGGDDNLAKACGKEATAMFESVKKHDPDGYKALQNFIIGELTE